MHETGAAQGVFVSIVCMELDTTRWVLCAWNWNSTRWVCQYCVHRTGTPQGGFCVHGTGTTQGGFVSIVCMELGHHKVGLVCMEPGQHKVGLSVLCTRNSNSTTLVCSVLCAWN